MRLLIKTLTWWVRQLVFMFLCSFSSVQFFSIVNIPIKREKDVGKKHIFSLIVTWQQLRLTYTICEGTFLTAFGYKQPVLKLQEHYISFYIAWKNIYFVEFTRNMKYLHFMLRVNSTKYLFPVTRNMKYLYFLWHITWNIRSLSFTDDCHELLDSECTHTSYFITIEIIQISSHHFLWQFYSAFQQYHDICGLSYSAFLSK